MLYNITPINIKTTKELHFYFFASNKFRSFESILCKTSSIWHN
ncbi:hypothetical protein EAKF1_ch1109 [Escherichia albertii KF1]|nr:hypothetical protein EAKF1_ch1109 [Escherichia albertii KF1]